MYAYSSAKQQYNEANEIINALVIDLLYSLDCDQFVYSEPILLQQQINTPSSFALFLKNKSPGFSTYSDQVSAYVHRQQKRVNTYPIQTAHETTGGQYYEDFESSFLEKILVKLFHISTLFYLVAFIIFHSILKRFINLMKVS